MENETDSGMELRDLLRDAAFLRRISSNPDPQRQPAALRRLARVFAEQPEIVLQELVDIAVEYCGADSAGVSLEEPDSSGVLRFRWVAIAGSFTQYVDTITPRFFSPCGTCLSSGRAHLFRVTKAYYDYLGIAAEPILDGILIPWVSEEMRGTLWAVSHQSRENFSLDDYELLYALSDFVSLAVRHHVQEKGLREKARRQAFFAVRNDLAHKINNPLQSLMNTIYLAGQGGLEAQSYANKASKELLDLSELVGMLLRLEVCPESGTRSIQDLTASHSATGRAADLKSIGSAVGLRPRSMVEGVTTRSRALTSWKEVASHMQKGVRTVQRWELLGLPIHRLSANARKSPILAYTHELDAWLAAHFSNIAAWPESNIHFSQKERLALPERVQIYVHELEDEISKLVRQNP